MEEEEKILAEAAEAEIAEEERVEAEAQATEEVQSPKSARGGEMFKNYFTATRVSFIAIFTALSYVLTLFDFSLLPGTPVTFLKLDFSNAFVMLSGFALGPVAGCIVAVLKELIHALTVGHTAFVGELANVLMVLPYMLIPAIVYKRHKGIKVVIATLVLGCIVQCLVSLPVNYLLTFPAFSQAFGGTWKGGQQLFIKTWYWALLFNLIKTVIISAVTLIVYKPLSLLIKKTNAKFTEVKNRRRKTSDNGAEVK